MEIVRSSTPLGREQTPEDVGKLASFLCSDDARNITGQVIALDGGTSV
jgi:enoyl-[acyl-carrier-protein] reductase (NADH)